MIPRLPQAARAAGGILLLISATAASAAELDNQAARALFAARGCNACHAETEFRIGPPYQAIAARYGKDPEERVHILAAKIRAGGAGSWGYVPMISNPKVSSEEAEAIARWILRQGQ